MKRIGIGSRVRIVSEVSDFRGQTGKVIALEASDSALLTFVEVALDSKVLWLGQLPEVEML